MNLRQMNTWGQMHPSGNEPAEPANPERFLTLVVEGAALGVPEIDAAVYKEFRGNVARLALGLPDRLPEPEKLTQVRSILQEFQNYRKSGEEEVRNRTAEWRSACMFLFCELLKSLGIERTAAKADELLHRMASAASAEKTQELHAELEMFLHPSGAGSAPAEASKFRTTDHSTANDNAAGLRGGGSAMEQLTKIMAGEKKGGHIVLFRLTCMNMISQRFGPEAVEDCLMAVAAFLTHSLQSDDTIYHWSDSTLLAILQGRVNEQILSAELNRIVFQNRETSVNIGGRATMLRIPLTFDITPIEHLQSPDDLYKITLMTTQRSAK